MERVGRVLGKLKGATGVTQEDLAIAAWPVAVGKRIASHCGGVTVVRSRLVVEVEDSIWQRQLFALRGQILASIHGLMGVPFVNELEFRVMIPRRRPQREESLAAASNEMLDDANAIRDPGLRNLYKAARRRSIA